MGNHEFCTGCHASDFHYGYTCEQAYPEGRARVLKERADRERQRLQAKAKAEELVKTLRGQGIPAELKEERFERSEEWKFAVVVIESRNLIGGRIKAMRDTDPKVRERRSKALERKYGDGW